ncbi:MAG: hypothetical protein ACLGI6_02640 [Gammaproteobacteria bacterium]
MTRPGKLRSRLLAPLVYLAAFILLIEEWFWDAGLRLVTRITAWPPLHALERRVERLSPYAALCAFVAPGILLFPVKILALMAIAHGHAMAGVAVIIAAKLGGAAVVARLYALTRPTLLSLPWFARWHGLFMRTKERWVGRLKATHAWRRVSMMSSLMRAALRDLRARLRPAHPFGSRHGSRPARMFRRVRSLLRTRRR